MRAGVTVADPASTYVDVDVRIGQDTVLEPGTVLRGSTSIGERCTIGPQATLVDCVVHDEATILHAYAVGATCHSGVSVGPFAYLRPGAVLREKAKAGTFVEIKNSDIGAGAKVPHLSYIGDADVGPGTNLGAGTITANYDGRAKHRPRSAPACGPRCTCRSSPRARRGRRVDRRGVRHHHDIPPGRSGWRASVSATSRGMLTARAAGPPDLAASS
jgi:NDP-sugar pyrophosphorylase family protein